MTGLPGHNAKHDWTSATAAAPPPTGTEPSPPECITSLSASARNVEQLERRTLTFSAMRLSTCRSPS